MKAEIQTTREIVSFCCGVNEASASKPGIPPYE
jgi:hypothetical protein